MPGILGHVVRVCCSGAAIFLSVLNYSICADAHYLVIVLTEEKTSFRGKGACLEIQLDVVGCITSSVEPVVLNSSDITSISM